MPDSGLIPPLIGLEELHEVMEWVGLAEPFRQVEHSQSSSGPPANPPADPAAAPADEAD
jgi:hypothetical protein